MATPAAVPLSPARQGFGGSISYDKRGADRGIAGLRRVAGLLRSEGYARAWLPHRSLRSALLARLAGIPDRTGFAGGIAGLLHTRRVARPVEGHESQRLLASRAQPRRSPSRGSGSAPTIAAPSMRGLTARGVGPEFAVMAPGARWATKRWPGFAELAASLPESIVVIGGPEDREAAGRIASAGPTRIHNAAGALTPPRSAALIARAARAGHQRLRSRSTSPWPSAARSSRWSGPTGPAPGFAPLAPLGLVVAHPTLACRPCSPHGHDRCPLGHHRCMVELEAERVVGVMAEG